ncbi:MAG TPA: hypothetical protein VIZ69_12110 [Thermoanaerobaculia bacterium]
MAPKKPTNKTSRKLSVKKETIKDLNAGSKAKDVKGGSLVDCKTRDRQG